MTKNIYELDLHESKVIVDDAKRTKNAKRFCPVCNPEGYKKYHNEEV